MDCRDKLPGFLCFIASIFLAVISMPASLLAEEGSNAGNVSPYYGSFSTEVPIAVPAYHGLEPKLKLSYSSTARDGLAGVGWGLSGISYIERGLPGGGSPKYDANDAYFLDGMELIPSTLQGGTHCTKIQNYTRIIQDGNYWYVYGTNGNLATYAPIFETTKGTFRWMLTSIADLHGNIVTYNYWCDGNPTQSCYLGSITYNGSDITLYYEVRPDVISYGTGVGVSKVNYRLKSVDVKFDGSRVRAYKLGYAISAGGRTLLKSVQQYGNDTSIDQQTGEVTGGKTLPAMTFDWQGEAYGTFTNAGSLTKYYQWENATPGDFNGDGKTDILINTTTPDVGWRAYLSDGDGTFTNAGSLTPYYQWHSATPGDFNGDGKTDILINTNTPDLGWRLYLSDGDGTFTNAGSLTPYYYYQWHSPTAGDFNGDGKTDILINTNATETGWQVFLSDGDGTFTNAGSLTKYYQWENATPGDFNGDGKTDILINTTTPGVGWRAYLSDGDGTFTNAGSLTTYYQWENPTPGDFNGDGKTDILINTTTPDVGWRAYLSDGDGTFTNAGSLTKYYQWEDPTSGDFNGDGKTDILINTTTPDVGWRAYIANEPDAPPPNLLTTIQNGIGGTTNIEYTPSSAWDNNYLPVGMILQTVSSITTDDGRGSSSTINYSYAGGLWSSSERRFLGFRKVTAALDAQGNYTETYYYQREGSISKPEYTYYKDNQGRIYRYSKYEYTENVSAPYTSLMTSRWEYECNLQTDLDKCYKTLLQFAYDQYGNVRTTYEYGDYDLEGDERETTRAYYPNTVVYLVGLPAYEVTYDGIGSRTALKYVDYLYDGNTSYNEMPTKGNITRIRKWNLTTSTYVYAYMDYDAFGNLTSQTNEMGHTATTIYDSVYHLYPVEECNALDQCVTTEWDTVMGQKLSVTDDNGAVVSYTYDPIGRPLTETDPAGNVTSYQYLDWGNPNLQRIRKIEEDGSEDGLWHEVYQDGLGREYKRVREGGFTQIVLFSDTSKRVFQESLWFAAGETPQYITYAYDGLGRQRTATNPDGSFKEVVYANDASGKPYTVNYDELRHERVTWKDAYGNLSQVREKAWVDGVLQYLYTTYEYDLLGNPVRIMDARQNATSVTTTTWDSLGRKLSTDDPDMGHWSYTYNNDGSLKTQTDAKGQMTQFTYDPLGRITSKTVAGQLEASYFYDEPGYGASIGRLTRVVHANGSETHTWDMRGQEIETTRCVEDVCQTIGQNYDGLGRVETITYPDGEVVTYDYDDYGMLVNVGNSSIDFASNLTWSSSGQLESMAYGNNTFTEFTYNQNRKWLSSATVTGPDDAILYAAEYTYDTAARVGTITSATNPLLNLAFTYDALNRLRFVSGGQSQTFAYDAIGNILYNSQKGTYIYDPVQAHAVTAAGGDSYTYDANGNMLSVNGTEKTFVWDAGNRLASVTNASGTTTFLYGPNGNRIEKTGPEGISRYFGAMVEEKNGTLIKYYYAGPMLIAKLDSGDIYWYHSDHLGSIRLMTDINGVEVKNYDYAAFGETVQEGGSISNERGFTGHIDDSATGLIHMGARYYDASLGRFISSDTIVPDPTNPQALNRNSYVYNNPISNTDPTGHVPVAAAVIGAALISSAEVALEIAVVAWIGAGITTAGYFLNDPFLMTVGSVMLGYAGGVASGPGLFTATGEGILAASVVAATSPISPLDPDTKEAVGWAYTAYGLGKAFNTWEDSAGMGTTPTEAGAAGSGKACAASTAEVGGSALEDFSGTTSQFVDPKSNIIKDVVPWIGKGGVGRVYLDICCAKIVPVTNPAMQALTTDLAFVSVVTGVVVAHASYMVAEDLAWTLVGDKYLPKATTAAGFFLGRVSVARGVYWGYYGLPERGIMIGNHIEAVRKFFYPDQNIAPIKSTIP